MKLYVSDRSSDSFVENKFLVEEMFFVLYQTVDGKILKNTHQSWHTSCIRNITTGKEPFETKKTTFLL